MKRKILVLALLSLSGFLAQASNIVVISEKTVDLNVDISTTKVKLSQADYAFPVVKVLVPELADVTILNHRNTGEGAPCMATYETFLPEDVVQNNPSIERVPMTVTLKKHLTPNVKAQTCQVSLEEFVEGKIRGFTFTHSKILNVGIRHIDDCR